MLISFDWDGCLGDEEFIQDIFFSLQKRAEIIIVTSRCKDNSNIDIEELIKDLNVKVHYTCGQPKIETLKELGVDLHFDNDDWEVKQANLAGINAVTVNPYKGDNWFINHHLHNEKSI